MTEATKTDFSKLNVYQKLAYVRQKAPYIQKSKCFMINLLTISPHTDYLDMTNIGMFPTNTTLTVFKAVIKPFVIF